MTKMKKNIESTPRKVPKPAALGQPSKVTIRKLPSGVRGLNEILGGGIPEFSFNVVAGSPGFGKTTLAHQITFANATWQATTFLVGEYAEAEIRDNLLFTVADGLVWLSQVPERDSVVRKLQTVKLRGQASMPGLHTFRITDDGLQAFSRTLGLAGKKRLPGRRQRLSIGIPELDKMMGGGILEGDSLLVAGPSGTGKSALATQFIAEGLRQGETAVMALFEERPAGYLDRAAGFGLNLKAPEFEANFAR
jgi:circadian clock protein KaiC